MAHSLDPSDFYLPTIDEFIAGDTRVLAFVVENDGTPMDLTGTTITWALFDREYQDDPADAVIDGGDPDVDVVTDSRVDLTAGEFEVRIGADASEGLYGQYFHRPKVEQTDGTTASWLGECVITA